MKNGQVEPARRSENKEKGEKAQHQIHRLGMPEKREQIVQHDRDDHDLEKGSNRMEKAHKNQLYLFLFSESIGIALTRKIFDLNQKMDQKNPVTICEYVWMILFCCLAFSSL